MLDNNVNTYYKPLAELSKLYGIQLAYVDVSKQRRQAPLETLLATLRSLGAPLEKPEHAADAIREKRDRIWRQCCEPVLVAWEGKLPAVKLNFAAQHIPGSIKWHLHLESGEELSWVCSANDFTEINSAVVNSVQYITKAFPLGYNLPPGYHQLRIDLGNSICSVLVISAPKKAFKGNGSNQPYWGVFMPLYALRTRGSWGGGDFADLDALLEWVHGLGGRFVGTLPLLATFFQDTRDLSPYFPASRLFWSEVYLDMRRILQEEKNPALAQLVKSPGFSQHLQALQAAALVDYRSQVQLKRSVLQHLATSSCMQQGTAPAEYYQYLQNNPRVEDYAEFRSAGEKLQAAWQYWPAPQKDGVLNPSDYNEGVKQYYLYAQWLLESQLKALTEKARKRDMRLYFDLPLGVSPQSYDVWRERESFISGISAGAPPDGFFTKGQQWELSPLHPQGLRRRGYKYYIECLRHNFKYAGILRIDHIMAFHRLYVIPDGFEATQGAYIRYQPDEFYAIVTLESHRASCLVLGEDLGTVPTEVR
ncbi:MAG TPA: 4-alpha-glucanotransferase, partial [Dehalococcoidia bacterium]|nr:4-alpha-glucanotransferase [Dehalococcoidia bacterium]